MQQLNNTVKKALAELKITPTDLSRRLGKSDNYIQMMLKGCTTKKQNELITMIEQVISGEVFKSDSDIIKELSEKLANSQDWVQHNADCAHKYLKMVHESDKEIERLTQKHNESMMQCSRTIEARQILLNQSEENTLYWISKVPVTRWQAFKLFIKLLITGKN